MVDENVADCGSAEEVVENEEVTVKRIVEVVPVEVDRFEVVAGGF